jgi:uncharacterized protein YyaL (SSP411 family)
MNRLANERSPYLRNAADQEIDWYPWCDEAFERARHEDKPIFLSSGATWCHWCHVMAKESFYDKATARVLNEKFICIKLDRDERPDIDRLYQQAVAAMVGGGGWPLSVFLTPEAKPFYGGSYFPPEDAAGRPGFRRVLQGVAELYATKRGAVDEYTSQFLEALKPDRILPINYDPSIVDEVERNLVQQMDADNGGFGFAPKFPMTGAIEFMLNRYFFKGTKLLGSLLIKNYTKMASGGFQDHLLGGFHRYSTDASWTIPHFEKMADDNAGLLDNYINAFVVFHDEVYRETAVGIARFITEILADPEGGFYASQDADVTPDDEGGYFTWTDRELMTILNKDEYTMLSRYFMHGKGAMHHDPERHVLFAAKTIKEVAAEAGIPEARALDLIQSGKTKLLDVRAKREAPFIDTTLYTSLNGMVITALIRASWVLKDTSLAEKALKGLNRIWNLHMLNGQLFHSHGVAAMLDDYVFLAEASVTAYETTGVQSWLDSAMKIMDICKARLWDEKESGFFDSEEAILGIRLKSVEDNPHPSANAVAIRLLQKLYYLTDKTTYKELAEQALKAFYARTAAIGMHWASYYSALDASSRTLKLVIHDKPDSEIAAAARSFYYPYKIIQYAEASGFVVPCLGQTCMNPLNTAQELEVFLRGLGKIDVH